MASDPKSRFILLVLLGDRLLGLAAFLGFAFFCTTSFLGTFSTYLGPGPCQLDNEKTFQYAIRTASLGHINPGKSCWKISFVCTLFSEQQWPHCHEFAERIQTCGPHAHTHFTAAKEIYNWPVKTLERERVLPCPVLHIVQCQIGHGQSWRTILSECWVSDPAFLRWTTKSERYLFGSGHATKRNDSSLARLFACVVATADHSETCSMWQQLRCQKSQCTYLLEVIV